MTSFRMTYEGTPYSPAILSCDLNLFERDGGWKGQEPGDTVTLYLSLEAEPFEYDVPEDKDEHLSMTPGVDTQWLELPVSIFTERDLGSLDGLSTVYDGPRSINALTGEEWPEPPGLLRTYGDEAFRRVQIEVRHREGARFALHLVGETEVGTTFDIECEAPLGVSLTSYTGQPGEDRLRRWFDAFLRWDDFAWERSVDENEGRAPTHALKGTFSR